MTPEHAPVKHAAKHLMMRLMRPGLAEVTERLSRIEARLGAGASSSDETDPAKLEGELGFWRWLVHEGGDREKFGESFEAMFGRWQRERLELLGSYLGLGGGGLGLGGGGLGPRAAGLDSGDAIDRWCARRAVVEIGSGPYPAAAAARHGWRQAIAVDPLARGYVEEGLIPAAASGIVFLQSGGERIPLASGAFDLVIIENCLDHVDDPEAVVREMERLLCPGGVLWFFVDLSHHRDAMHPHPMSEERVLGLLRGFELVRGEASDNKAHPEAFGSYRALFRKPGGPDSPPEGGGAAEAGDATQAEVRVRTGSPAAGAPGGAAG